MIVLAEFTAPYVQQIAANANAVFTETPVTAKPCIVHRQGSGLITLRGITNQCYARYLVVFSGNIAIPALSATTIAIPAATVPTLKTERLIFFLLTVHRRFWMT